LSNHSLNTAARAASVHRHGASFKAGGLFQPKAQLVAEIKDGHARLLVLRFQEKLLGLACCAAGLSHVSARRHTTWRCMTQHTAKNVSTIALDGQLEQSCEKRLRVALGDIQLLSDAVEEFEVKSRQRLDCASMICRSCWLRVPQL